MINYYQPYLLPFLGSKRHNLQPGITSRYYHSWEDAFWDVLRNKKVKKGTTVLVPNFYCMDVLENIERHGYQWKMYLVDEHFQTTENSLCEAIKRYTPGIIIIFHVAGITSHVLAQHKWKELLSPHTIIIEDNVHRLLKPQKIKVSSDTHFIIDSLRKVSPLPGSFIYGTSKGIDYTLAKSNYFSIYFVASLFVYILFRLFFMVGMSLNYGKLVNFSHTKILKLYDNIIGNNWNSPPGIPGIRFLYKYLDFEKIETQKEIQVGLYAKAFETLYTQHADLLYKINIPESDFGLLHVYPVGIKGKPQEKLITFLHANNITVWYKFPDCPWSEDKGVLFLPLGFHIKAKDIEKIRDVVAEYLSSR